MEGGRAANDLPRDLLAAITGLTSDLELASVLQRIVVAACNLTGARYGALGVVGRAGGLSEFVHHGMDPETVSAIGHLPEGHGVLGVLLDHAEPLRITELGAHRASAGFPAHHPPMTSFLGVPIRVRGEVFGNIYLTEKADTHEFDAADEATIVALAAAAGAAIDNARLFSEQHRREQSLAALQSIATALLAGQDADQALEHVVFQSRILADARLAVLVLPATSGGAYHIASANGDRADELVGITVAASGSISAEVIRTGQPFMSADITSDHQVTERPPHLELAGPAIFVPLYSDGRPFGALAVINEKGSKPFEPADLAVLQSFATQASVAIELGRNQRKLEWLAEIEAEERVAHELHDTAIQSLFRAGMGLQSVVGLARDNEVAERLHQIVEQLDDVITSLRSAAFGSRRTPGHPGG